MIAIDTNVVVRFLTQDHPTQYHKAIRLFQKEEIWISKTVLLETYWVLESLYKFSKIEILKALGLLAGLPNVEIEDFAKVAPVLTWYRDGMDFADAIHLASAQDHTAQFFTFDKDFIKKAKTNSATALKVSLPE